MAETDRWRKLAAELSLEFDAGIAPYLSRVELLSALQGKKVDFDSAAVGGVMGGFLESMLAKIMVGVMHGNRNGFEVLVYRDVKHRIRESGGLSDEYLMNCAVLFPVRLPFEFSISRGRKLVAKHRIRFGAPDIDRLVTAVAPDPEPIAKLFAVPSFRRSIGELYDRPGNFTVRNAGIVFQEKSTKVDAPLLDDAIDRMVAVAPSLTTR